MLGTFMYSIPNVCGFTDRSRLRETRECPGVRGREEGGWAGWVEGCGEIDEELAGIIRRREREGDVEESRRKKEGKRRLLGKAAPDKT